MSGSPTATVALPTADAVARLLRDLFGKTTGAKIAVGPASAGKTCLGTYVDETGAVRVACVLSMPIAASMGCVLALIPARAASEAATAGVLTSEIADNLREVLNVLSTVFGPARVRFQDLIPAGTAPAPQVAALLGRAKARVDFEVTVAGYPPGRMTLLAG